ncbi:hypothetical protein ACFQY7_08145 [Actinomadura luteofluorescens]|uniref:hypothetical protein n=1 Tax=Actinomadura luteofluorescens TaxID=46163 RepID=UPI00363B356A
MPVGRLLQGCGHPCSPMWSSRSGKTASSAILTSARNTIGRASSRSRTFRSAMSSSGSASVPRPSSSVPITAGVTGIQLSPPICAALDREQTRNSKFVDPEDLSGEPSSQAVSVGTR